MVIQIIAMQRTNISLNVLQRFVSLQERCMICRGRKWNAAVYAGVLHKIQYNKNILHLLWIKKGVKYFYYFQFYQCYLLPVYFLLGETDRGKGGLWEIFSVPLRCKLLKIEFSRPITYVCAYRTIKTSFSFILLWAQLGVYIGMIFISMKVDLQLCSIFYRN